jgi:hypothetical protein
MIRKILLAVMLAAGLSSSAFAQASFTVKDSASVTQTFKSFNCSATICALNVPADTTGAAFGISGNPFFMTSTSTLSTAIIGTATISTNSAVQPTTVLNTVPTTVTGTVTISSTSAVQPTTVLNTVTISSNSAVQPTTVLNTVPTTVTGTVTVSTSSATLTTKLVDGSNNIIGSTSNNLNVQCANCSGSGVSAADNATWTANSSLFAATGGAYQTTTTSNPLTPGHQGFAQLTQFRALMANLQNAAGAEVGNQTNPLSVTVANTNANQGTNVDSIAGAASSASPVNSYNLGFDGSNWDRQRIGQTAMVSALSVALASNQSVGDPCTYQTKSSTPIAAIANAVTQILVPGVSAKRVYVCSIALISSSGQSFSMIEGSGATCGSSTAAVMGGTTALSGLTLAANGGITLGSGSGTVAQTATNQNNLCLTTSLTPSVAGNLMFVQQ